MKPDSLFSIIIPCYNQAQYLNDAVSSVLGQSISHWELIIVNDGATDNTLSVAERWAQQDNRVRVVNQHNQGLAAARNNGMAASTGLFLLFLDADDKLRSRCLEQMRKALVGGADIVVAGYAYFNDSGSMYKEVLPASPANQLLTSNLAPPVAFGIRRESLEHTGLFDKEFNPCEDWDLWTRFYKAGKQFAFLPQVLADYRVVPNSMSRNAIKMYDGLKRTAYQNLKSDYRIKTESSLNRDFSELNITAGLQHSLAICLGLLLIQGKRQEAIRLFRAESNAHDMNWKPNDFAPMCSFLSFRYWMNDEELSMVLNEFRPLFHEFFEAIGLSPESRKAAMQQVFRHHVMMRNRKRFGPLGQFMNRYLLKN